MVRNIQIQDAQDLEYICKMSLGHETTAALLEQRIKELSNNSNYSLLVYEDDATRQVLGFLQAEQYNLLYGGNGWNIIALAVSPEVQQQGIGKQLLTAMEDRASKEGYSFIRLNCNITRTKCTYLLSAQGLFLRQSTKTFYKSHRITITIPVCRFVYKAAIH